MPAVFGPSTFFSASTSTSPSRIGRDFANGAAAHRRRRRIGAVRRVGHDDLGALDVAAVAVVRHDHRDAGEFALRTGHRRERDAAFHAGDVGENFLQIVHAGQENPATQRFRRIRMPRQKSVEHRQRIARARVVLHRARTERIELRVDREILARQVRVMTQRLQLGNFRQTDRFVALQMLGQIGWERRVVGHLRRGHPARLRHFENQHGMRLSGSARRV